MLSIDASKFGGLPYCEAREDWSGRAFLGQIDLTEATACLAEGDHPYRDAPRPRGLVRMSLRRQTIVLPTGALDLEVKYFPAPSVAKAIEPRDVECVGSWETRMIFEPGWSLPEGSAWEAIVPEELRDDLGSQWIDAEPDEDWGRHRLFGWRASGLDEHYRFDAPPGLSSDIADYEMLLRLTSDVPSGIDWGTNWIYLIVPSADFSRSDLQHILVSGANA